MKNKELLMGAVRFGARPNDAGIIVGHTRDEITLLFEDPEILFTVEANKLGLREMLFDSVADRLDYGENLWLC